MFILYYKGFSLLCVRNRHVFFYLNVLTWTQYLGRGRFVFFGVTFCSDVFLNKVFTNKIMSRSK